jgi:chitin disaccharide deacetylase
MSRSPKAAHLGNTASTTGVMLCADDFAMTNGVSRAIVELAEQGRISATSAMTTSPHWPAHATWLARIRGGVSAGLHLNLTLGSPLGAMPKFAPGRRFPGIGKVTSLAVSGRIDKTELAAEIARQLASFEAELGFPPDHIDGHQHVHALPTIRTVLLDVLQRRYGNAPARPLLRAPADRLDRMMARGAGRSKGLTLAGLTVGFGSRAPSCGPNADLPASLISRKPPSRPISQRRRAPSAPAIW